MPVVGLAFILTLLQYFKGSLALNEIRSGVARGLPGKFQQGFDRGIESWREERISPLPHSPAVPVTCSQAL